MIPAGITCRDLYITICVITFDTSTNISASKHISITYKKRHKKTSDHSEAFLCT